MAVLTPRRSRKNPEGRMPLREHLAELRRRLVRSALAIVAGAVVGWFAYPHIFAAAQEPLKRIARERNISANINFPDLMGAFNLHLSMSAYLGIALASPVWLYQIWAFIVPGLTKREKRHAMAFAAVGAPLFLAGCWIGWMVLPNAVTFFADFAEPGTSLLPSANTYFAFVTRLLLAFGFAFLLPLFLVALNMAGVVSARAMGRAWRVAVFLIFLFAAIASPTPDAGSMLALALPMCGLYAIAVGVATIVDRRRARQAALSDLDADVASEIDAPEAIESPTPVAVSASADEPAQTHTPSATIERGTDSAAGTDPGPADQDRRFDDDAT